jgi:Lysozyme like domain
VNRRVLIAAALTAAVLAATPPTPPASTQTTPTTEPPPGTLPPIVDPDHYGGVPESIWQTHLDWLTSQGRTPAQAETEIQRVVNVAIIRDVFPDNLENKAVRVAWCESRLSTWAVSRTGRYIGLYQIAARLHGYTRNQMLDPRTNAEAALRLHNTSGWRPWPVCGRR